jgi:hypothetical protein
MPVDLFEQLAELPVPPAPPPEAFDRAVHQRINDRLIVGQLLDFLLHGFGFAMTHFAKAILGLMRLTFTGKLDVPKNGREDSPM